MDRQELQQRKLAYGKPYPGGRPAYYAARFIRTLFKTCAALQVEAKGVLLLTLIASLEDSKHRTGAVLYTDEQMMPVLGVDKHALVRVRRKCVEAGWLHFEPGWKNSPSRYWTNVPVQFTNHTNDLLDEDFSWCGNDTESRTGNDTESRTGNDTESRTGRRTSVFPVPNPNPPPSPAWGVAEAAVRETGITNWRRAVADCQKHGLQPRDVQDLVAWWRGHQSEFSRPQGALCFALRNADPSQSEDWGKAFPQAEKTQTVQRPLAAESQRSVQAPADPFHAQNDRLVQLEFKWEAEVKGLTIAEIVTKFELPAELQSKLAPYRTWEQTSRADTLRLAVLSIVEQRLAS